MSTNNEYNRVYMKIEGITALYFITRELANRSCIQEGFPFVQVGSLISCVWFLASFFMVLSLSFPNLTKGQF